MAMRDPVDMAAQLLAKSEFYRFHALNKERSALLVALIREAQEDGARAEREKRDEGAIDANEAREIIEKYFAHVPPDGVSTADVIRSMCAEHARSGLTIAALTERAERAGGQAKGWRERALAAETRVRDLKSAGFAELADIGEWPISSERKDAVFRLARERAEAIRERDEMLRDITGDRC